MRIISKFINKIAQNNYYHIRLNDYYFDNQKQTTMAVICLKNKRMAEVLSINDIIFDKTYFNELHQTDCCLLGFLANIELAHRCKTEYFEKSKIMQAPKPKCLNKTPPLLEISHQYTNNNNDDFIVLKLKKTQRLFPINVLELFNNVDILSNLSQIDALSIGFSASNSFMKGQK